MVVSTMQILHDTTHHTFLARKTAHPAQGSWNKTGGLAGCQESVGGGTRTHDSRIKSAVLYH